MVLDIKALRNSGKTESSFFFEYSPETELSSIPEVKICLPIKVVGKLILADAHSAYIEGEINYTMQGECTRCLSQTERAYLIELSAFAGDSEDGYPVVNDKVDLSKIVDDAILTDMPITFLCRDDCKGLCIGCGVNLNENSCKCKK